MRQNLVKHTNVRWMKRMCLRNVLCISLILLSRCTKGQVVIPMHSMREKRKSGGNRFEKDGVLRKNAKYAIGEHPKKEEKKNSIVYSHIEAFGNIPNGAEFLASYKTYLQHKHSPQQAEVSQESFHLINDAIGSRTWSNHPLFQGLGSHYVPIYVGTPPQRATVLVDTGSHQTAFPCSGCSECGEGKHTDRFFRPEESSTFRRFTCAECVDSWCNDDRCELHEYYMEGSSWRAYQASDKVVLDVEEGGNGIDFMLGCQISETGLFVTQLENGIMGMAETEFQLAKNLFSKEKIPRDAFSLCFGWEDTVSVSGVHSGMMTLGGTDTRHHKTPMVYAKRANSHTYYNVFLRKMHLRSETGDTRTVDVPDSVNAPTGYGEGIMIDSGTTYTFLPSAIRTAFDAAWKDLTGFDYTNSPLSVQDARVFPTLLLQFKGADQGQCQHTIPGLARDLDPQHCNDVILSVPPSHYLFFDGHTYTSHFYFSGNKIIGANVIQGHDVLFDSENGRLGFAESTCDYSLVESSMA